MIESLESRRLLTAALAVGAHLTAVFEWRDGSLYITATDNADVITTAHLADPVPTLIVTINGQDYSFDESGIGIFGGVNLKTLAGDDLIHGGGVNFLFHVDCGEGADKFHGNDIFNIVAGGSGRDTIYGGLADDSLIGNQGSDRLYAGRGNDHVYGREGNDSIEGGRGDDTLSGNAGDDTLRGQDGNDRMIGSAGSDRLLGGAGNDRFLFDQYDVPGSVDTLNGGDGNDFAEIDDEDTLISIESMVNRIA